MSEHWNPTKKEIEDLLDQKLHEFMIYENKTPHISEKRWLDHYLYIEIHEIFFVSFSSGSSTEFLRLFLVTNLSIWSQKIKITNGRKLRWTAVNRVKSGNFEICGRSVVGSIWRDCIGDHEVKCRHSISLLAFRPYSPNAGPLLAKSWGESFI